MLKSKIVNICRKLVHFYVRLKYFRDGKDLVSKVIRIRENKHSVFFGYHDKSPFSENSSIILAHRAKFRSDDKSAIKKSIEVGFYKLVDKPKFVKIGVTRNWCWQQGSMLQFLPKSDSTEVIFNTEFNNQLGSKIVDINTLKTVNVFSFPIYSISLNGEYASSLNFVSLGISRPGYGYFNCFNDEIKTPFVRIYSLKSKKLIYEKLILSKNEYVNHISFSPDSKKIIFFKVSSANNLRKISIESVNLERNNESFTPLKGKRFSHYCWLDNDRILFSIGKKFFWGAYIFDFRDKSMKLKRIKNLFTGDFHPMKHPLKSDFIADTYVVDGMQKLIYAVPKKRKKIMSF